LFHLLTVMNTLCSWVILINLLQISLSQLHIQHFCKYMKTCSSILHAYDMQLSLCLSCSKIVQMKICYEICICFPSPSMTLVCTAIACIHLLIVNYLICFITSPQATQQCFQLKPNRYRWIQRPDNNQY
jgi:hypothetical protein